MSNWPPGSVVHFLGLGLKLQLTVNSIATFILPVCIPPPKSLTLFGSGLLGLCQTVSVVQLVSPAFVHQSTLDHLSPPAPYSDNTRRSRPRCSRDYRTTPRVGPRGSEPEHSSRGTRYRDTGYCSSEPAAYLLSLKDKDTWGHMWCYRHTEHVLVFFIQVWGQQK